ncbi:hypothetical protein AAVH_17395, partial [Aphelenchoides avenae]
MSVVAVLYIRHPRAPHQLYDAPGPVHLDLRSSPLRSQQQQYFKFKASYAFSSSHQFNPFRSASRQCTVLIETRSLSSS